ncbi:HAD-IIIC family phosphatase [Novosphingobium sp. 9U]|uniref:HAD-IIIC family phosphatase n=1 Tax=Novosphingobium sp. 9U TaxID=2653158 RepID=UPI0012F133F8|nr:HAD-IIIC family phosphatase [Novosphingobium sp. 9U]VWX53507.1 FkbH like protein [Novosphingobium sp. 9U]
MTFVPTATIKLVIWDLDDTFWHGTLSEGPITLIEENLAIVRALADRGVVSSIVSKNDAEPVRRVLEEAGIWDSFIFPKVSWNAKGSQIAQIIDQANLRPDNVLFIDDNSINIEEARFRFPTMMVAYPQDVLPVLLTLPEARGKSDPEHTRLKQYKQLERKVVEQAESDLSNVDFLRQSEIRLRFDFDVERHLDRIVELINRSNQLNYTKVRLESDAALATFREQLQRHDVFAAAIFASDKYGSHGLIGFYMQQRTERENRLLHYVWSCRMMNAGLEQYVYERLGSPAIDVVGPVSNPIIVFDRVDWINDQVGEDEAEPTVAPRLLLLGSCDLTAVASYCSANRAEFVNGVKHGVMTRYDDFGFILDDANAVAASRALPALPAWEPRDYATFHHELAESEILVLSLSAALKGHHLVTGDGVVVRIHPEGLGHAIDHDPASPWLNGAAFYDLSLAQKLNLLERAVDLIDRCAVNASHLFLLGANTRDAAKPMNEADRSLARQYNEAAAALCAARPGWEFVSIDEVVAPSRLIDDRHYTRTGYLDIANHLNARIAAAEGAPRRTVSPNLPSDAPLVDLIRQGRKLSRLAIFGNRPKSQLAPIKQAVKLTPLSRMLRKAMA